MHRPETDRTAPAISPDDEAALRRLTSGSLHVPASAIARLVRQGLLETRGRSVDLTPYGRQVFRSLKKAILQECRTGDPIEATLSKHTARFQAAHAAAPPRRETRGRPRRQRNATPDHEPA